jgi:hypothetical protein
LERWSKKDWKNVEATTSEYPDRDGQGIQEWLVKMARGVWKKTLARLERLSVRDCCAVRVGIKEEKRLGIATMDPGGSPHI